VICFDPKIVQTTEKFVNHKALIGIFMKKVRQK